MEALQSFANQNAFDLFDAELFQILTLGPLLHVEAEVRHLNLIGVAHEHGALQRVLQFANVARPGILHHGLQRGRGESGYRSSIARSITRQEMRGQRGNIFATFAQGGHMDLDRVQAEQQIFAEIAGRDRFLQTDVGGGDDANVDALGARGAHALDLAGFEHPQQLGLLANRNIADFVEKDSAVVGQLEAANAIGAGIGESAFHVSEQFALESAFGQRRRY